MAEIELELPYDSNNDYLPLGKGLVHSLIYKNTMKKIPVRVYFTIPDVVFINTYVDSETGDLVDDFPAKLVLELLTKNMVVTIEQMNY